MVAHGLYLSFVMEAERFQNELDRSSIESEAKNFQLSDPLVIAAGALIVGYAIGAGRWNWLNRSALRLAEGLGALVLAQIGQSFQEHNPQFFGRKERITH